MRNAVNEKRHRYFDRLVSIAAVKQILLWVESAQSTTVMICFRSCDTMATLHENGQFFRTQFFRICMHTGMATKKFVGKTMDKIIRTSVLIL